MLAAYSRRSLRSNLVSVSSVFKSSSSLLAPTATATKPRQQQQTFSKPLQQHFLPSWHLSTAPRAPTLQTAAGVFNASNASKKKARNALLQTSQTSQKYQKSQNVSTPLQIASNSARYFSSPASLQTGAKRSFGSRALRFARNTLLLLLGSIALACCVFYYNHRDEGNWRRSLYFWKQLYPIYVHYRWVDFYSSFFNFSPEKRELAFSKLHVTYKTSIADIVRHLRGFYIKLAQLGAARSDIIPIEWIEPLRELEDNCPFEPFETIESIVTSSYGVNSLWDIFSSFDPIPLGSASIGQAHKATLKATGDQVVVKVQYPGVEELFRGDFLMARKFCAMAQPAHLPFLDETERQFLFEFNYNLEAQNLVTIRSNLQSYNSEQRGGALDINPKNGLDLVHVPVAYTDLCTDNVLVMEYLPGHKLITSLENNLSACAKQANMSLEDYIEWQKSLDFHPSASEMRALAERVEWRDVVWNALSFGVNVCCGWMFALLGHENGMRIIPKKSTLLPINVAHVLDVVADVHGYEVLIDGAFNGDPHPGNILVIGGDGLKGAKGDFSIGLIDYGQVKHLTLEQRIELSKLLIYLGDNDSERIIAQMRSMGFKTKYSNDWVCEKSARMFFDKDDLEVTEGMNAQLFLEKLNAMDPVVSISDDYVMVGRLTLLMSGLFHALGYTFEASKAWRPYADRVLKENGIDPYAE